MWRYLCEGLLNWTLSTLSRADSFVVDHDAMWGGELVKGRGAAGGGGGEERGKGEEGQGAAAPGWVGVVSGAAQSVWGLLQR